MTALVLPDWSIDGLSFSKGRVEANGWILPRHVGSRAAISFNGILSNASIVPARPDVVAAWAPVAGTTTPLGFFASAQFTDEPDTLLVELYDDGQLRDLNAWSFKTREEFPIPDATRRERVCGSGDPVVFLRNGLTNYKRLRSIAERFLDLRPQCSFLDWGCGAGSVARYIDPSWAYVGVDIDPDNIGWCQQHLTAQRFVRVEINPPMPFDAASFDLCFGISVMTHLGEADQLAWLAELARVMRPGSLCLLSLLGRQALAKAPWLIAKDSQLVRRGVLFAEDDHEIGRIVGASSYYGTTYHLESYIRAKWSEWFDVVGYFPAGLGHQDVVALQARI